MPRYRYECLNCGIQKTYFHSMEDKIELCEECGEEKMQKLLTNTFISSKRKTKKASKVGEITKKYIEDNREILNIEKEKAAKESYEPS